MKIIIVSDLHIKSAESPLAKSFVLFLNDLKSQNVAELWLLGDIFDLLIGDFDFWHQEYRDIFLKFLELSKSGCKVLWIEGNHDFYIHKLLRRYDVQVCDEEITREISNKKVFFAHGDLVNQNDHKYLKWRKFTRSYLLRQVLDKCPNNLAKTVLRPLANKISSKSRGLRRDHFVKIQKIYQDYAHKKFQNGISAMFLGHCHVADLYTEGENFYCNLGSGLEGTLRYAEWNPQTMTFPKVQIY